MDTVFPYLARELSLQPEAVEAAPVAEAMTSQGLLQASEPGSYAPPPTDTAEHHRLHLLAEVVMPSLQRLYIVASLLTGAPRTRAELLRSSQSVAELLARLYGLNAPEFSDRRLFDQFVDQMLDRGVVAEGDDGRLVPDELVHAVTRLARHIIPHEFQRAVQRVGTHRTEQSAP